MFSTLKNKITNFASYLLGLDEQLANAKTDKERNKILTQIVEAQRKRIDELNGENSNLKEENAKLIKELEEGQTNFISSLNLNLKDIGVEIERIEALIEVNKTKN